MASDLQLAQRVAVLVEQATGGTVNQDRALEAKGTFLEIGMTSLAYLRLIDSVENEFGVYVDLEDETVTLNNVETFAAYIETQGVSA